MATTATKKLLDEAYAYAKSTGYTNDGDIAYFRVTGGTTASYTGGSESSPSSGTAYVIALTKVEKATKVMLNDTDYVTFAAGDPKGTCLTGTLTKAVSNGGVATFVNGVAGEQFVVMKDPSLTSADTQLVYVNSKSGSENSPAERAVFDKGIFKGVKRAVRTEPDTLSITQGYQAHDKGLAQFKGQRFNLLLERDDSRNGTVTEKEYYFDCFDPNAGPNESSGDSDSDVSYELQYLFKGVVAG